MKGKHVIFRSSTRGQYSPGEKKFPAQRRKDAKVAKKPEQILSFAFLALLRLCAGNFLSTMNGVKSTNASLSPIFAISGTFSFSLHPYPLWRKMRHKGAPHDRSQKLCLRQIA